MSDPTPLETAQPEQEAAEVYTPSRTQKAKARKADESRLAQVAKQLVNMSNKQLRKVPLDELTKDAVDEARRISSKAALGRQLRIVRRALRDGDPAVFDAVDLVFNPSARPVAVVPLAEQHPWLPTLLGGGNPAIEHYIQAHETLDRQQLRQLVREAKRGEKDKRGRKAHARLIAMLGPLQPAAPQPAREEADSAATPAS